MKKILTLFLALCLICGLCACGDQPEGSTGATLGPDTLYSVKITTSAGVAPSGIKYYVYKDASQSTGIAAYGTLDSGGEISFTAPLSDTYTLVLEDVEEGYDVQPSYTLTQPQTEVVLESGLIQGQEPTGKVYLLGDIMRDFTITDCEGNSYTISQLLETKKCVVLNFWNIKCDPCKAEFPYLLRAYEAYKEDIALIAMNPIKTDTTEKIKEYKDKYGLTFPMAACDESWIQAMTPANPTTVIIDRYGRICVKETGSIQGDGIFEKVFAHFVSDDYEQILIRDMAEYTRERAK